MKQGGAVGGGGRRHEVGIDEQVEEDGNQEGFTAGARRVGGQCTWEAEEGPERPR